MYRHAGLPSSPASKYWVRTTPAGAETSLSQRTSQNIAVCKRFSKRKRERTESVAALDPHQRINRVLRLSRVDPFVVALLGRQAHTKPSPHFKIVGTHALYGYESAAWVRLDANALAARVINLP